MLKGFVGNNEYLDALLRFNSKLTVPVPVIAKLTVPVPVIEMPWTESGTPSIETMGPNTG